MKIAVIGRDMWMDGKRPVENDSKTEYSAFVCQASWLALLGILPDLPCTWSLSLSNKLRDTAAGKLYVQVLIRKQTKRAKLSQRARKILKHYFLSLWMWEHLLASRTGFSHLLMLVLRSSLLSSWICRLYDKNTDSSSIKTSGALTLWWTWSTKLHINDICLKSCQRGVNSAVGQILCLCLYERLLCLFMCCLVRTWWR